MLQYFIAAELSFSMGCYFWVGCYFWGDRYLLSSIGSLKINTLLFGGGGITFGINYFYGPYSINKNLFSL